MASVKTSDKLRLCIDLKSAVETSQYQMPTDDDMISYLNSQIPEGTKYLKVVKKGYYYVKLKEESSIFTIF